MRFFARSLFAATQSERLGIAWPRGRLRRGFGVVGGLGRICAPRRFRAARDLPRYRFAPRARCLGADALGAFRGMYSPSRDTSSATTYPGRLVCPPPPYRHTPFPLPPLPPPPPAMEAVVPVNSPYRSKRPYVHPSLVDRAMGISFFAPSKSAISAPHIQRGFPKLRKFRRPQAEVWRRLLRGGPPAHQWCQ